MRYLHTDDAPKAIGPYSQAVETHGWVYTSGQVALDPATGKLVEGDFEAQAKQVLKNLEAVLATAGCTFKNVVKATVYLQSFGDFATLNRLYADVMGDHRPSRSTVQVAALPLGALVEIDFVARVPA